MIKHPARFLLGGLLAGWLVDLLFWKSLPGISFPIWVVLTLGIGFALLYGEGLRPSRWSWVLAALAVLFACLSISREEGFSAGINMLMTFFLLALLAATLRSGNWPFYRMMDGFIALLRVTLAGMGALPMLLARKRPEGETPASPAAWKEKLRRAAPVLRGLLLAIPVLLVLGSLLASADPLFNDQVSHLFDWLRFENLQEFLFRAFYICLIGYVLGGIFTHSVENREERPDPSRQWVKPFLGFTESGIVLLLVDAMFAVFVGIQFIYLFGGEANITAAGYTYADYARRGFFELVTVAVLSLMLYLTLGFITRRESVRSRRIFTILVVVELLLVVVMLVSAFQRMALYQGAYGFSQLRVQVNVLMIWLGLLLGAAIVLELLGRSRHFGLAALIFCVGFVFTMGVFNMDGFIANQNIDRARQGEELDSAYLSQLSADATPAIYAQFASPDLPLPLKSILGGELACRSQRLELDQPASWLSLRFSKQISDDLLRQHTEEWRNYPCRWYGD